MSKRGQTKKYSFTSARKIKSRTHRVRPNEKLNNSVNSIKKKISSEFKMNSYRISLSQKNKKKIDKAKSGEKAKNVLSSASGPIRPIQDLKRKNFDKHNSSYEWFKGVNDQKKNSRGAMRFIETIKRLK